MSRAKVFGEEKAKEVKAHGEELKASVVKYCDCRLVPQWKRFWG